MELKAELKAAFWRTRLARWGRRPSQSPGYTLLLPVPGDLPVFLDLALAVCRLQTGSARLVTVVIPDAPSEALRRRVAEAVESWPGRLEYVPLALVDRVVLPRLRDPGRNHGTQIVRGVHRSPSTHVILHDADLFLMDERVHDDEYALAVDRDLDALGVSPPWDPWYAERGRHLAATWELCARVDWLRAFPPYRHLGHDAEVEGESHTFDTTFWAQLHTAPDRVAVGPGLSGRLVHFNYVISVYRSFQRSTGPFHDKGFQLLLIRLFIELFAPTDEHDYGVPGLEELSAGLGRLGEPGVRVGYQPGDGPEYLRRCDQLRAVTEGPWSSPERAARCLELLGSFDAFFGVTR